MRSYSHHHDFHVIIQGSAIKKVNSENHLFNGPVTVHIDFFTTNANIPHTLKLECNFEKYKLHGLYYALIQGDNIMNTMQFNPNILYGLFIAFYDHGIRNSYSLLYTKGVITLFYHEYDPYLWRVNPDHAVERYVIFEDFLLNLTIESFFQTYPTLINVGLTQTVFNLGVKDLIRHHTSHINIYKSGNLLSLKFISTNGEHKYLLKDDMFRVNFHQLDNKWLAYLFIYNFSKENINPDLTHLYQENINDIILYMDDKNVIHYMYVPNNGRYDIYRFQLVTQSFCTRDTHIF